MPELTSKDCEDCDFSTLDFGGFDNCPYCGGKLV